MSKVKKIIVATVLVILWVAFVLGIIGLASYLCPMGGNWQKGMDMLKLVFAGMIPGYFYVDFLLDMAADSDVLKNN